MFPRQGLHFPSLEASDPVLIQPFMCQWGQGIPVEPASLSTLRLQGALFPGHFPQHLGSAILGSLGLSPGWKIVEHLLCVGSVLRLCGWQARTLLQAHFLL